MGSNPTPSASSVPYRALRLRHRPRALIPSPRQATEFSARAHKRIDTPEQAPPWFYRKGAPELSAGTVSYMSENDTLFAQRLRAWRRLNGIKQLALADMLGVSQAAVSCWETGRETPSAELMKRIHDMISQQEVDEVLLERVFTERQPGIMALYDLDGVRFLAASRGYRALWPGMSLLTGMSMASHLINESGLLLANQALRRDVDSGQLALISGVSDRHTDIIVDTAVPMNGTSVSAASAPGRSCRSPMIPAPRRSRSASPRSSSSPT